MKVTDVDLIQTHPKNQSRNRGNYAFYGQLSQLLFNAKMQWQVLDRATPAGTTE